VTRKSSSEHREYKLDNVNLSDYLVVYNRYNDMQVGYVGNVNRNGIMLITPWVMDVGAVFSMRIRLPESIYGKNKIDFTVRCLWCHHDVTPGNYDSGYSIVEKDEVFDGYIEVLKDFFLFND